MATPFTTIYDRAIFKFADYKFLEVLVEEDRNAVLERYLTSANADFAPLCLNHNLNDRDMELKQYNEDLEDDVIEVLSTGISYYWLYYHALNSELLKNGLNTSEYSYFSPGNLLDAIKKLKDVVCEEYYSKMRRYTYVHADFNS